MPCELCDGRGWITLRDSGNGSARRCACQAPTRDTLLERAGIPPEYRNYTRANFPGEWPAEASFWPDERPLLYIYGNVGAGKTHIGTALLIERIESGERCAWWDTGHLLETMKKNFGDERGYCERLQDEILRAQVLMLDELLITHKTAWADFMLAYIIRQRIVQRRDTILTTPLGLLGMDELDPGLSSRLKDQIRINLSGEIDHRRPWAPPCEGISK